MRDRTRDHTSWVAVAPRVAGLAVVLLLASASAVVAQPKLLHVGTEVTGGNGDDWIEPGETVSLRLSLFNDGNTTAMSVSGTLTYLGAHPSVAVTIPTATWPNLPAQAAPALTNPPDFELQLGSQLPCGAVLPFQLDVQIGADSAVFSFTLKVGRRTDYDMLHDPILRFDEQEATFWGAVPAENHGSATAFGDVNGDGYADAIMASRVSPSGSGALYLVYGQARHHVDMDLLSPVGAVSVFTGLVGHVSLASGDVNQDGYDDIIVGAPFQDSSNGPQAGVVLLIYGRATQWPNTYLGSSVPITGVARFAGADANDWLGASVGSGDINGDGYKEILAGAPKADSIGNTRAEAGEVYLIQGQAAPWADTDLLTIPAGVARFWGVDTGDELGAGLANSNVNGGVASGDVDGDGFDDLLLGAHAADSLGNLRTNAGEVTLVYGRQSVWTDTDLATPGIPGVARFWGATGPGVLALSARATEDFNADGIDDLVLGSVWGSGAGRPGAWQLYLIYGRQAHFTDTDLQAPPPGVARLLGEEGLDRFGAAVATGDLNADGYGDLIAGAPQDHVFAPGPGKVYVIYGSSRQWADVDLRSRPSTIAVFQGVSAGSQDDTGFSAAAGDVNNDGYDDLLIGAQGADSINNSRLGAGEAYLWYGKPTDTYYVVAQPSATVPYIEASGPGGVKLPLNCDDCSVQLPLPFEFPFYAEEFDTIFVSSNGFLSFSPPTPATVLPEACMPDRGGANNLIAPYWDDLNPALTGPGGGVYVLLSGTAPYRRVTIEWKQVPHATGTVSFEATLFESTGEIRFNYKDIIFGVPSLDKGASAVVGVENRNGAHGVVYSCNDSNILGVAPMVRFIPSTPIFEEHGELTGALWDPTGHWHDSTNTCEPDQHGGERGWYYGNGATCGYPDGFAGSLHAPTVLDFPNDARLAFWSRLGTQAGIDLAQAELSTTGTSGPYSTVLDVSDNLMYWRYPGVTNLFNNQGDTVDLRWTFSSDGSLNSLGWMVDDIQLVGCGAIKPSLIAHAVSYAPPQACESSSAVADAYGSYCEDSFDPVRYQWFENGAMIPGADGETHTIPDTLVAGTYEYGVEITCEDGTMAMSAPAPVTVVAPPDPVAPTLQVDIPPQGRLVLRFQWEEAAGAEEYVVLQDTIPNGGFTTVVGVSPAGEPSLSVPIPPGDLLYFLVAGRNQGCGLGPIH